MGETGGCKSWRLLDGVREIVPNRRIAAFKHVSETDLYLQGHFSAYSVYPGMLLVEGIVQAANRMFLASTAGSFALKLREGEWTARFLKPVVPGDTVEFIVTAEKIGDRLIVAGEGQVRGILCVRTVIKTKFPSTVEERASR